MTKSLFVPLLAVIAMFKSNNNMASAFLNPSIIRAAPPSSIHRPKLPSTASGLIASSPLSSPMNHHLNPMLSRHSTRATRMHSFFGLGPAEILIVAIAGLVVIGPSKLLEFSKEAGSVAGKTASEMGEDWSELKAIPEEFQKGVEEGEIEARSRKAKDMEEVGNNKE